MPARTAAAAACSLLLAAGIVGARVPGPHAVVSSNAQLGTPLSPAPLVLRKHYRAADRTTGRYQYLPFDVTAAVSRIRLSYSYDREGGNAIGLGLFEPGPLTFGTAAFRGWSGRERDTIEIGEHWSSPGYRVGPVRQGQWNVVLGLERVGEAGVDVTVTLEVDPPESLAPAARKGDSTRAAAAGKDERAGAGLRWWHGDLHVHTEHSDGRHPVADVARLAAASGLDFIVITDHNNTTHRRDLDGIQLPLILSGEEVTTPGGHANVWGLGPGDWFDFRIEPRDPHLLEIVDGAHARGALFAINHPFLWCDQCSWTHDIPATLDALEIWNGPLGPQPEAVALWERLLKEGRRVTAVASSDWHRAPARIGAGSVRVLAASLDERSLFEAIRQGHVVLMRDAAAPAPRVIARAAARKAGIGDTLEVSRGDEFTVEVRVEKFVSPGAAGCPAACRAELVLSDGRRTSEPLRDGKAVFTVQASGLSYLRLEVNAGSTVLAMTNPIWLQEMRGTARHPHRAHPR